MISKRNSILSFSDIPSVGPTTLHRHGFCVVPNWKQMGRIGIGKPIVVIHNFAALTFCSIVCVGGIDGMELDMEMMMMMMMMIDLDVEEEGGEERRWMDG